MHLTTSRSIVAAVCDSIDSSVGGSAWWATTKKKGDDEGKKGDDKGSFE